MDYDYGHFFNLFRGSLMFNLFIAFFVLTILIQWKVYSKAGKPGWASFVPIYNYYVLFQIVGMKPWFAFLIFVPLVGYIVLPILLYIANFKLAKAFGKDDGFGIGLLFLTPIFLAILAFGDATYVGIPNKNTPQTPTI